MQSTPPPPACRGAIDAERLPVDRGQVAPGDFVRLTQMFWDVREASAWCTSQRLCAIVGTPLINIGIDSRFAVVEQFPFNRAYRVPATNADCPPPIRRDLKAVFVRLAEAARDCRRRSPRRSSRPVQPPAWPCLCIFDLLPKALAHRRGGISRTRSVVTPPEQKYRGGRMPGMR